MPESRTEKPKTTRSPTTGSSTFMLPPTARKSPPTLARELTEPAKRNSSPNTGDAVTIEPPNAKKSPATGAVRTTENPAAYAFPFDELSTISERADENDDGAPAWPVG